MYVDHNRDFGAGVSRVRTHGRPEVEFSDRWLPPTAPLTVSRCLYLDRTAGPAHGRSTNSTKGACVDHNRDSWAGSTRGYALSGCVPAAGWCPLLQRPVRMVVAVDVAGDGAAGCSCPYYEQTVNDAWVRQSHECQTKIR